MLSSHHSFFIALIHVKLSLLLILLSLCLKSYQSGPIHPSISLVHIQILQQISLSSTKKPPLHELISYPNF